MYLSEICALFVFVPFHKNVIKQKRKIICKKVSENIIIYRLINKSLTLIGRAVFLGSADFVECCILLS